MCTPPGVRELAGGKLLCSTGSQPGLCDDLGGRMGEVGERLRREGLVRALVSHLASVCLLFGLP